MEGFVVGAELRAGKCERASLCQVHRGWRPAHRMMGRRGRRARMCGENKGEDRRDGEEADDMLEKFQDELRKRTDDGLEIIAGTWGSAKEAIALVYRQGSQEGIYSVALSDGTDLIITFEDKDDAIRYAEMLTADDFPESTLEVIDTKTLDDICKQTGATFVYVRKGTTLTPPRQVNRSSVNDWEEMNDRKSVADRKLKNLKNRLENLYNSDV